AIPRTALCHIECRDCMIHLVGSIRPVAKRPAVVGRRQPAAYGRRGAASAPRPVLNAKLMPSGSAPSLCPIASLAPGLAPVTAHVERNALAKRPAVQSFVRDDPTSRPALALAYLDAAGRRSEAVISRASSDLDSCHTNPFQ